MKFPVDWIYTDIVESSKLGSVPLATSSLTNEGIEMNSKGNAWEGLGS